MPLPVDYGTGTVTGTFTDTNGDPVVGTISFTPSASRLLGTGAVILGDAVVVDLDADGSLSVTLPASNDPNVLPTDFTYRVDETFVGTVGSTYFIEVLEGTTLDLSDVAVPGVVNNGTVIFEGVLPPQTGHDGEILRTDGTDPSWVDLGIVIADAPAKTVPVGSDKFVMSDSDDSDVEKRISFSDLAAALGGGGVPDPTGETGKALVSNGTAAVWAQVQSDAIPQALGTADAGVGTAMARDDHVHEMPSAADVGAPSGSGTSTGTNTGDQTITLTGDITGSGTGSLTTAIGTGVIVDADVNASAAIAQSKIASLTTDLAAKAPLASPALTGTPTAPTPTFGTNTTQVATTEYTETAAAFAKPHLTYAGAYQASCVSIVASTITTFATVNYEGYVPMFLVAGTYDRVGLYTTVAAVSTWEMGLYTVGTSGQPTSQVTSFGSLNMNATAGLNLITLAPFTVTTTAWYYVGIKITSFTASPTLYRMPNTIAPAMPGWPLRETAGEAWSWLTVTTGAASGALPSTAPAIGTGSGQAAYANLAPRVLFEEGVTMSPITEQDGHGRILSTTTDNGDGTGTRTFYGPDGEVTGIEELSGLPIPEPPAADPAAVLAAVGASLAAIPANATSTQMRSTLRTLGEQITESIPT